MVASASDPCPLYMFSIKGLHLSSPSTTIWSAVHTSYPIWKIVLLGVKLKISSEAYQAIWNYLTVCFCLSCHTLWFQWYPFHSGRRLSPDLWICHASPGPPKDLISSIRTVHCRHIHTLMHAHTNLSSSKSGSEVVSVQLYFKTETMPCQIQRFKLMSWTDSLFWKMTEINVMNSTICK